MPSMAPAPDQDHPATETITRRRSFAQVPDALVADLRVTPVSLRLWLILDRYAGKNGRTFPSRARLAQDLGVSVATIKRALGNLVDTEWIVRTPRPGGSWNTELVDRPGREREAPAAPQTPSQGPAEAPVSDDPWAGLTTPSVAPSKAEKFKAWERDDRSLWESLIGDNLIRSHGGTFKPGDFTSGAVWKAMRHPSLKARRIDKPGTWLQECHDLDVALSRYGLEVLY